MDEISSVVRLRQPDEIDDPLTELMQDGCPPTSGPSRGTGGRSLLGRASGSEACRWSGPPRPARLRPEREVQTGIGAVSVARPKVQDRGSGEAEHLGGVGIVRLSSAAMVSGH